MSNYNNHNSLNTSQPLRETGGIIYNVTVRVDKAIAGDWLQWTLKEHAPKIVGTKCFTYFSVLQLLDIDDSEGPTYAVQYFTNTLNDYHKYIDEYADDFRNQSSAKWGNSITAFRTIMKVIN